MSTRGRPQTASATTKTVPSLAPPARPRRRGPRRDLEPDRGVRSPTPPSPRSRLDRDCHGERDEDAADEDLRDEVAHHERGRRIPPPSTAGASAIRTRAPPAPHSAASVRLALEAHTRDGRRGADGRDEHARLDRPRRGDEDAGQAARERAETLADARGDVRGDELAGWRASAGRRVLDRTDERARAGDDPRARTSPRPGARRRRPRR